MAARRRRPLPRPPSRPSARRRPSWRPSPPGRREFPPGCAWASGSAPVSCRRSDYCGRRRGVCWRAPPSPPIRRRPRRPAFVFARTRPIPRMSRATERRGRRRTIPTAVLRFVRVSPCPCRIAIGPGAACRGAGRRFAFGLEARRRTSTRDRRFRGGRDRSDRRTRSARARSSSSSSFPWRRPRSGPSCGATGYDKSLSGCCCRGSTPHLPCAP
mmetsp:Transcript_22117/g.47499  ORF Transcript_22117/g.47499 Transcript_22117/m.47499 type:complete len:214 (+) Transcript_22117:901-1542(+)